MQAAGQAHPPNTASEDATLAEILSTAAHELRQPATVIYGLAETLRAQLARMSSADVDQSVRRIEQQATRLVKLLDDLLDVSRLESGQFEVTLQSVDLAAEVEKALALAPPPPSSHVNVMLPADIGVLADPIGLERILVNLLTNAYRYGGPNILLEAKRSHEKVRVAVSDDGRGVPAKLLPQLFNPFRAEAGGTGLGLSIVRGLVEAFGGSISYEPTAEGGARFEMTLIQGSLQARDQESPRYAAEPGGAVTILVVDDEPDVLFLLRLTLESAGYSVVQAAHGAEALVSIEENRPTLLITDLMMPVMDGRELIRRVRNAPGTADLPIVLLSANPDQSVGADRVMRKPFNPRDLTRTIDELVGREAS